MHVNLLRLRYNLLLCTQHTSVRDLVSQISNCPSLKEPFENGKRCVIYAAKFASVLLSEGPIPHFVVHQCRHYTPTLCICVDEGASGNEAPSPMFTTRSNLSDVHHVTLCVARFDEKHTFRVQTFIPFAV